MSPAIIEKACAGYPQLKRLQQIVAEGVRVHIRDSFTRPVVRPTNHGSARERLNVLRKNIRKEQDAWRCLVLDKDILDLWPEIVVSPFGVVDKSGGDPASTGRTIILGATAVNEDKFTGWSSSQKVLGLEFDCAAKIVSMPGSKLAKARRLVASAFHSSKLSRRSYRSLLGSLRHVATCIRSARPFLQRLRIRETQLHRFQSVSISEDMKSDLQWWWVILHSPRLNGVAMEYFQALPSADITVETDASDLGLCALDVTSRSALTYQFTPAEAHLVSEFKSSGDNGFDINFRELVSCAFAVHAWGERWAKQADTMSRPLHIHFRIDNTSAVAWQTKMASRNPRAQVIIRLLGWWETTYHLRFSASHIPGNSNHYYQGYDHALATYLRAHSVADPTFSKYAAAMNKRSTWTARRGIHPRLTSLHINDQVRIISNFVVDGFQHGYGSGKPIQSSTILSTLHGIKHFFAAEGFDFPIGHPHISMLLKGIRRIDPPRQRKAPVSIQLLEACFDSLQLGDAAAQALWGVLCVSFFFLLRRSEIAAISRSTFKWFVLHANDISVADIHGFNTSNPAEALSATIRLRGSKTNQNGRQTTRMLERSGHEYVCPVLGAMLLLRARGDLPVNIPAAVFLGSTGLPACVSTADVSNTIKKAASRIGEDASSFSSHSLRAGGATHMYRAGTDAMTIQFHGRWKSDAFKSYTRLCSESVSKLASKMVEGSKGDSTLR